MTVASLDANLASIKVTAAGPEPANIGLIAGGLAGLAIFVRRRRR
jgi:hypothetical protein